MVRHSRARDKADDQVDRAVPCSPSHGLVLWRADGAAHRGLGRLRQSSRAGDASPSSRQLEGAASSVPKLSPKRLARERCLSAAP